MTKLGGTKHLKRLAAPRIYPVYRKRPHGKYTIRPAPGPHPKHRSVPLAIVLRDVLGYAKTLREARKILAQRLVYVDGRVITDYRFPIGLMDVLYLKEVDKYWRVLPLGKKLYFHEITPEEAKFKIVRITSKQYAKSGWIQIGLEDGRSIIFKTDSDEKRREILDKYKTWDAVKIAIPSQEILGHFELKEDMYGLIMGGTHAGEHGQVIKITKQLMRKYSTVTLKNPLGEYIATSLVYLLIIGKEKPEISLPEIGDKE
ncbi:MAG: 30S ribosomal protein S4e [Candidatus Njordarchaeota archaeon]